jgi:hypothetical protein
MIWEYWGVIESSCHLSLLYLGYRWWGKLISDDDDPRFRIYWWISSNFDTYWQAATKSSPNDHDFLLVLVNIIIDLIVDHVYIGGSFVFDGQIRDIVQKRDNSGYLFDTKR